MCRKPVKGKAPAPFAPAFVAVVTMLGILVSTSPSLGDELRVRVLDFKDGVSTRLGVTPCLNKLHLAHDLQNPRRRFDGDSIDVFIIGSMATHEKDAKKFFGRNKERIREFVAQGGIVIEFLQGHEDSTSPEWLPEGLSVLRGDRDATAVEIVDAPLAWSQTPNHLTSNEVAGGAYFRGDGYYAATLWRSSDLFVEYSGFVPLALSIGDASQATILAGRGGAGLVILTATPFDKVCASGETPEDEAGAQAVVENLLTLARRHRANPLEFEPGEGKGTPRAHRVEVFWDNNGDGVRDDGELPVSGVTVGWGLASALVDDSGECRFTLAPGDDVSVYLRIPEGTEPTNAWFEPAENGAEHSFGLAKIQGKTGAAPRLVQLSDVHIGRVEPADEGSLLRRFMEQLAPSKEAGDLVVATGDLTHLGAIPLWTTYLDAMAPWKSMTMNVMGNHDKGRGPDVGRLFEQFVAPTHYTREWNGFLLVALPRPVEKGEEWKWLKKQISGTTRPAIILTHYFPTSRFMDRLPKGRVVAVLSGHWHGDQVAVYKGIYSVNSPTALMGSWDFSPASARVLRFAKGALDSLETVPFVIRRRLGVQVSRDGTVWVGGMSEKGEVPECVVADKPVPLGRLSSYTWRGKLTSGKSSHDLVECTLGDLHRDLAVEWDDRSMARVAKQGKFNLQWGHNVPGRVVRGSPVAHGKVLLVPVRNLPDPAHNGAVYALSTDTGEVLWKHTMPTHTASRPAVYGAMAVVTEVTGDVWALRIRDGKVLWHFDMSARFPPGFVEHYVHVPPVLHNNTAWYCYQGGPFALELRHGEVVWAGRRFTSRDSFATGRGAIFGDHLYCGNFLAGLFRYDRTRDGDAPSRVDRNFLSSSDLLLNRSGLWGLGRGVLEQLDPGNGEVLRRFSIQPYILPPTPVVGRDYALLPDGHEGVYVLNLSSGKRRWSWSFQERPPMAFALNVHESSGLVATAPVRGGRVYVPGVDGTFTVLDLKKGKELSAFDIGVPVASRPEPDGDSVYVVDYAGTVYRYDRR